METSNKTTQTKKTNTCLRFTPDQLKSFLRILKLMYSHVQINLPDGCHYIMIGEEPRRLIEYLCDEDVVFMEMTLDKLVDLLGVKL